MPTYDYACKACGHRFEEFQSMSSDPLKKCPSCNKNKLERLIGAGAGVIFKGSGFYETDYRSSSYAADAKKDSDSKDTSGGDSKGGCQPTCGTSEAPAGCAAPKSDD
ncbi:MAG: zinc ribbon domain-containing protein [Planctomycetes bacterium]|nr:zinc ribbon domain-containing protein [Planctomycetota bacterium]